MANDEGIWGPFCLDSIAHTMELRPEAGPADVMQLAVSSCMVGLSNYVDVLDLHLDGPQVVMPVSRLPHYYPPTRVRWVPSSTGGAAAAQSLLVTSGDYIRVWSTGGELRQLLRHDSNPSGFCTPITSVDAGGGGLLVSCDVYGVCAVWDLERGALRQAFDLRQPLSDVMLGPGGLLVAAGDKGHCFAMDPRAPGDVHVLEPRCHVAGPARIAWSRDRPDLFAVAWQGDGDSSGIGFYECARLPPKAQPQILRRPSVVADLKWCPASPEVLCCCNEAGAAEVWRLPMGDGSGDCVANAAAAAASGPFRWQPCQGQACTALAMSGTLAKGQCAMIVATMDGSGQGAPDASLWIARLPGGIADQASRMATAPSSADVHVATAVPVETLDKGTPFMGGGGEAVGLCSR
eukprot:NODE_5682_length_1744_cov_6.533704.p1 GENE.NODE_5682_length_1744_cov_6.533704~~NODE_5682_length_1744_cov_6.533704.p1  ORF type:complete len:405 (-),score=90.00 NODE_5682_length_1744_cov_6.533704:386-1600(-)